MSEVLRLLRKDLRRLRWPLALWVAILAARVALAGFGSVNDDELRGFVLERLAGVLATLEVLMMGLIIARLVHEEPLVGMNAFWVTRPYHRALLFAEKLSFVLGFLVLLPAAADIASMLWFHPGPGAELAAASNYIADHLTWALVLFVFGVLTASLGSYVLTIVGVCAALTLTFALLITLTSLRVQEDAGYGTLVRLPDPTPGLVLMGGFAVMALLAIAWQYRHRRLAIAAPLSIAALVVPLFGAAWSPWHFARPEPPALGDWSRRAGAVIVPSVPVEVSDSYDRRTPSRIVLARVDVTNMPPEMFIQTVGVRSRLTMADGTLIRTEQSGPATWRMRPGIGGSDQPLGALTGGARALGDIGFPATGAETWPPIANLTVDQYQRYRGQTGRLDATVEFQVMRPQTRELPLQAGASIGDATSQLEIVRTQQVFDQFRIDLRSWRARSLVDASPSNERRYILWNRGRSEVLVEHSQRPRLSVGIGVRGGSAVTAMLPFLLTRGGNSVSVGEGGSAFSVGEWQLQFPLEKEGRRLIDADWLAGAKLLVVESAYTGILTRQITVDAFTIPK